MKKCNHSPELMEWTMTNQMFDQRMICPCDKCNTLLKIIIHIIIMKQIN